MTEKKYQVVFYGEISPGVAPETVKQSLAKAFKVDRKKIDSLFSGKKKVVKKDASRKACENVRRMFQAAGAVCAVVPQGDPEPPSGPAAEAPSGIDSAPSEAVPDTAAGDAGQKVAPPGQATPPANAAVNKAALLLLTFFLGGVGVHKFYLSKNLQGVLFLLFCWTGIPALIALIEFIVYAATSQDRLNEKYAPGSTPLVIVMAVCAPLIAMVLVVLAAGIMAFVWFSNNKDVFGSTFFKFMTTGKIVDTRPVPGAPGPSAKTGKMPAGPGQSATSAAKTPEKNGAGPSGRLMGLDFSADRVYLQNGVLHLKQGEDFFADREIIIFLFLENNERISGRTFNVSAKASDFNAPHIHLRWKTEESKVPQSEVVMNDYTMRLAFDRVADSTVTGKIDLTVAGDGDKKTRISGPFTAKVKQNQPVQ